MLLRSPPNQLQCPGTRRAPTGTTLPSQNRRPGCHSRHSSITLVPNSPPEPFLPPPASLLAQGWSNPGRVQRSTPAAFLPGVCARTRVHTCPRVCVRTGPIASLPGRYRAPGCVWKWTRRSDARPRNPSPYPAGRSPCSSAWPAGRRRLQRPRKPTPRVPGAGRQEPRTQEDEVKQDPLLNPPFPLLRPSSGLGTARTCRPYKQRGRGALLRGESSPPSYF